MYLVEMKRRLDSVPQPNIRTALADFEAHLIALGRRQKFTICPPRKRTSFIAAHASITPVSSRPKICKDSR